MIENPTSLGALVLAALSALIAYLNGRRQDRRTGEANAATARANEAATTTELLRLGLDQLVTQLRADVSLAHQERDEIREASRSEWLAIRVERDQMRTQFEAERVRCDGLEQKVENLEAEMIQLHRRLGDLP